MHTTRFWENLHQLIVKRLECQIIYMFLGRSKRKSLNRVAKGYLCQMKIGVTMNTLHHLEAVNVTNIYIYITPCQCQSTGYWVDNILGD